MSAVNVQELSENASALVRRVKTSEEITITVAGHPATRIVPIATGQWHSFDDIADLFNGPVDTEWERDRNGINHSLRTDR